MFLIKVFANIYFLFSKEANRKLNELIVGETLFAKYWHSLAGVNDRSSSKCGEERIAHAWDDIKQLGQGGHQDIIWVNTHIFLIQPQPNLDNSTRLLV